MRSSNILRGKSKDFSVERDMPLQFVTAYGSTHEKDIPCSWAQQMVGPVWVAQDNIVAATPDTKKFRIFDFKTQKWTDLADGTFVNWAMSLDGKYFYFTTGGLESKAERIRLADRQIETITSLKDLHRVVEINADTDLIVAPDGSPVFTRDIGSQEIYALNIRWP